jgi:hypothetical protein
MDQKKKKEKSKPIASGIEDDKKQTDQLKFRNFEKF